MLRIKFIRKIKDEYVILIQSYFNTACIFVNEPQMQFAFPFLQQKPVTKTNNLSGFDKQKQSLLHSVYQPIILAHMITKHTSMLSPTDILNLYGKYC